MYIIMGDVHQFIGRFINPLDPWINPGLAVLASKIIVHIFNYKKSVVKRSFNVLRKNAAFNSYFSHRIINGFPQI